LSKSPSGKLKMCGETAVPLSKGGKETLRISDTS
jgi:hypothetical protein